MTDVNREIASLSGLSRAELRIRWRQCYQSMTPDRLSRDLLTRGIAFKIQEHALGGLSQSTKRKLQSLAKRLKTEDRTAFDPGPTLKLGAKLVREWHNRTHTVIVREDGFDYNGQRYRSLSHIARLITGVHWSGPRFFGLRQSQSARIRPEAKHDASGQ